MPEPKRYVKLPVVIEAMRFDGSVESTIALTKWLLENGVTASHSWDAKEHPDHPGAYVDDIKFYIPTLEGVMEATMGDFIIQGVQGEFYPCKPDIFAATYREMTDDQG